MEEKNQLTEAEKMERVERLRQKTGLTWEEAKDALEANEWDMLEAMVYLERIGLVSAPKQESYTTGEEKGEQFEQASGGEEQKTGDGVGDMISRFLKGCGRLIKLGCENTFCIKRNGEELMSLPILVLIVLICAFFWVTVPLLVVGLFLKCRYSFQGKLFEERAQGVNEACDKMANACENIKKEFTDEHSADRG